MVATSDARGSRVAAVAFTATAFQEVQNTVEACEASNVAFTPTVAFIAKASTVVAYESVALVKASMAAFQVQAFTVVTSVAKASQAAAFTVTAFE